MEVDMISHLRILAPSLLLMGMLQNSGNAMEKTQDTQQESNAFTDARNSIKQNLRTRLNQVKGFSSAVNNIRMKTCYQIFETVPRLGTKDIDKDKLDEAKKVIEDYVDQKTQNANLLPEDREDLWQRINEVLNTFTLENLSSITDTVNAIFNTVILRKALMHCNKTPSNRAKAKTVEQFSKELRELGLTEEVASPFVLKLEDKINERLSPDYIAKKRYNGNGGKKTPTIPDEILMPPVSINDCLFTQDQFASLKAIINGTIAASNQIETPAPHVLNDEDFQELKAIINSKATTTSNSSTSPIGARKRPVFSDNEIAQLNAIVTKIENDL